MQDVDNLFDDIHKYLGDNPEPKSKLFTDEEYERIILMTLAGAAPEPVVEEHIVNVIRWAESIRVGESLVSLLLEGLVFPIWDEEEGEPKFTTSEKGTEIGDQLNNEDR